MRLSEAQAIVDKQNAEWLATNDPNMYEDTGEWSVFVGPNGECFLMVRPGQRRAADKGQMVIQL